MSRTQSNYIIGDGQQVSIENITIFKGKVVELFQIQDGVCNEVVNFSPRKCAPWVPPSDTNNAWTQVCIDQAEGQNFNMTTIIILNGTRVSNIQYSVSDKGVVIAGLGVYRTTFADNAPNPSDFKPPSNCTSNQGPFNPESCTGVPLDLTTKFPSGAVAVSIFNYTMRWQSRDCTMDMGCRAWGPARPQSGPGGVGTLWFKMTPSGAIPSLVDKMANGDPIYDFGVDCQPAGQGWNCGNYGAKQGDNPAVLTVPNINIMGDVLNNCARFYGYTKGQVNNNGAWTEFRAAFLAAYQ
jgi:hypothetical protein